MRTSWGRILIICGAILFLLSNMSLVNAEANYNTSKLGTYPLVNSYKGPEGITIRSYSEQWSETSELRAVYQELLKNVHGEELAYLGYVDIYPDFPLGKGVAGLYHSSYRISGTGKRTYEKNRIIDIYGGDQYVTLDRVAKTLAHEYGHHFTLYHLWMKEGKGFDDWADTQWAKARGLENDTRVTTSLRGSRAWHPGEIMAEDYVQLFGSPLARQSAAFTSQYGSFNNSIFNLIPQENLELPLAAQVEGLEEYWLNIAGIKNHKVNPAPLAPGLVLAKVDTNNARHPILTFKWNKSLDDKPGALEYTLVYYRDRETLPGPVYTLEDRHEVNFVAYNATDVLNFRVYVKDQENKIVSSPVIRVDLRNPSTGKLTPDPLFRDILYTHWAYGPLASLVDQDLVAGYSDNTFLPNKAITRAEFVTLLARALKLPDNEVKGQEFADTKGHWARGAIGAAVQAGLVGGYEDGSFKPNQPIARGEVAAILTRALEDQGQQSLTQTQTQTQTANAKVFKDTPGHWAEAAIQTISVTGLMGGYPDGTFRPKAQTTRAESGAIMARYMER